MEKVFDQILSWEGGSGSKKYLVSPRTVNDFFTHGIQVLRIPDYQRPYSWTTKNIKDLLNDVYKFIENYAEYPKLYMHPKAENNCHFNDTGRKVLGEQIAKFILNEI